MTRPDALLDELTRTHRRFEETISALSDDDVRAPSALPGWSVAHVITHVARNADALAWMAAANARGEHHPPQYPGGQAQRDADIEAGVMRSAVVLHADVVGANARLEALLQLATDEMWRDARGKPAFGPALPMLEWVLRRMRESEIHRTDTGVRGLGWRDWPDEFVDTQLGEGPEPGPHGWLTLFFPADGAYELVATDRPGRWEVGTAEAERVRVEADRKTLLAWLMGRTPRPATHRPEAQA